MRSFAGQPKANVDWIYRLQEVKSHQNENHAWHSTVYALWVVGHVSVHKDNVRPCDDPQSVHVGRTKPQLSGTGQDSDYRLAIELLQDSKKSTCTRRASKKCTRGEELYIVSRSGCRRYAGYWASATECRCRHDRDQSQMGRITGMEKTALQKRSSTKASHVILHCGTGLARRRLRTDGRRCDRCDMAPPFHRRYPSRFKPVHTSQSKHTQFADVNHLVTVGVKDDEDEAWLSASDTLGIL